MKKFSPQTKSFIILFCIALVGTYLSLMVSRNLWPEQKPYGADKGYSETYYPAVQTPVASANNTPLVKQVDTSAWKTYSDAKYGFSFIYDPAWKVSTGKTDKDGFYVLDVDPGTKFYNIKIYVSDKEYYALDGLPTTTENIGGEQALNVSSLLYGIKKGPYYYTFDNGLSTNLIDPFNALVHSVKFQ